MERAGGGGEPELVGYHTTDASHSPLSPSPLGVSMAGVGHDRPQDWIVGVALLRAAIERLAIEGAKRHIEIKPGHKVRVADEGLAKRDEIGAPRHRRAAEQRDECAPRHSITSSARTSIVGGISRPSACAVLRLITNSNAVGSSTGRSAGRAPFRDPSF